MTNTIRPQVDGPLLVEGDVELFTADGALISKATRVWLCRCGRSAKKPFCDGAHGETEFSDPARVPVDYVLKKPEPGKPPENLRLTLRSDGPTHCFGDTRIHGKDGTVWQGSQANLCRCGQSANKPFCDGTHRKSGFLA